jgi:hypothetical protein
MGKLYLNPDVNFLGRSQKYGGFGVFATQDLKKGKTTLETSGEDDNIHSKRVEKMINYTRNEWGK